MPDDPNRDLKGSLSHARIWLQEVSLTLHPITAQHLAHVIGALTIRLKEEDAKRPPLKD